jgi:hypothetical protein
MHGLDLAMPIGLGQHGIRPIFLNDSLKFLDDQLDRFFPGDANILTLAPVLGVSLTGGIPIHPLERVQNAVRRIDALFIGQAIRRDEGLHAGFQDVTVSFHFPRIEILRTIFPIEMQGPDPDYPAVFDIDYRRISVGVKAQGDRE